MGDIVADDAVFQLSISWSVLEILFYLRNIWRDLLTSLSGHVCGVCMYIHRGSMSPYLFSTGSYIYMNSFILAFGIWAIVAVDSVDAIFMVSLSSSLIPCWKISFLVGASSWPLTWIFNRLLEVGKIHVHAKFHQAKCSGSRVIMLTEKKLSNDAESNTAVIKRKNIFKICAFV